MLEWGLGYGHGTVCYIMVWWRCGVLQYYRVMLSERYCAPYLGVGRVSLACIHTPQHRAPHPYPTVIGLHTLPHLLSLSIPKWKDKISPAQFVNHWKLFIQWYLLLFAPLQTETVTSIFKMKAHVTLAKKSFTFHKLKLSPRYPQMLAYMSPWQRDQFSVMTSDILKCITGVIQSKYYICTRIGIQSLSTFIIPISNLIPILKYIGSILFQAIYNFLLQKWNQHSCHQSPKDPRRGLSCNEEERPGKCYHSSFNDMQRKVG